MSPARYTDTVVQGGSVGGCGSTEGLCIKDSVGLLEVGMVEAEELVVPIEEMFSEVRYSAEEVNVVQVESNSLELFDFGDVNAIQSEASSIESLAFGADLATNEGPDTFTNPNNALGFKNGTLATRADTSSLSVTEGALRLGYPNLAADLRITPISAVQLKFYVRNKKGLTGHTIFLEYRIGSTEPFNILRQTTNAFDFLTNPDVYLITADIAGSWANLDNLETRVRQDSGLATDTSTVDVDAVECEVVF